MQHYRAFAPNGYSNVVELNDAAAAAWRARPGWALERLGPSKITVVEEPAAPLYSDVQR